ncbi:hypothetical protein [Litorimonas sp.]|uniref:hypothetical protein n=1 Tax=Litorimonas sp. TaxID=1892381 RepID=UPI003A87A249
MDKKTFLRTGLFASALFLTTSLATTGFAEEYQSLPDLSPEEIALDVKQEFNNRTGQTEYIAPTYDPFEEDRAMAGSVNLRSVSGPVTAIDGEVFTGGVILDMAFYYNSHSDDPYDVRGFTDASFLSGSLAPALLRDNRVLECSRNVQDVVYDHSFYYAPTFSYNIFRPNRYYGGYHRYGRFDRPYWRHFGSGYGRHSGGWSRGGFGGRYDGRGGRRDRDGNRYDRDRDRDRGDRDRGDRDRGDRDRGDRDQRQDRQADFSDRVIRSDLSGRSRVTVGQTPLRAENRRDRSDRDRSNNDRRSRRGNDSRDNRAENRGSNTTRTNTVIRAVPEISQRREKRPDVQIPRVNSSSDRVKRPAPRPSNRAAPRRETRSVTTRSTVKVPSVSTPRAAPPRAVTPQRSAPPRRSMPQRSAPQRSAPKAKREGTVKGNVVMNFFQSGSSYSRDVVRSVEVDCAREETLSVFIPAGRLDAARYDGLTILALDVEGREYPIFVPPNYIEGFNLAVGENYNERSSVTVTNPQPVYRSTSPYREIEPVDCPEGTITQSNGTCMIDNSNKYPQ